MSEFSQMGDNANPDRRRIKISLDNAINHVRSTIADHLETLDLFYEPTSLTPDNDLLRAEIIDHLIANLNICGLTNGTCVEVSGRGYIVMTIDGWETKIYLDHDISIRGTIVGCNIDDMPVESPVGRDYGTYEPTPYISIANCHLIEAVNPTKYHEIEGEIRIPLSHLGLSFDLITAGDGFISIDPLQEILVNNSSKNATVVGIGPDMKSYNFCDQAEQLINATRKLNSEVDENTFSPKADAKRYIPQNGIEIYDRLCLFGINELFGNGEIIHLRKRDVIYGKVIEILARKDNPANMSTSHDENLPFQFVYTLTDIIVAHEDGATDSYFSEAMRIKIDTKSTKYFSMKCIEQAYSDN